MLRRPRVQRKTARARGKSPFFFGVFKAQVKAMPTWIQMETPGSPDGNSFARQVSHTAREHLNDKIDGVPLKVPMFETFWRPGMFTGINHAHFQTVTQMSTRN